MRGNRPGWSRNWTLTSKRESVELSRPEFATAPSVVREARVGVKVHFGLYNDLERSECNLFIRSNGSVKTDAGFERGSQALGGRCIIIRQSHPRPNVAPSASLPRSVHSPFHRRPQWQVIFYYRLLRTIPTVFGHRTGIQSSPTVHPRNNKLPTGLQHKAPSPPSLQNRIPIHTK